MANVMKKGGPWALAAAAIILALAPLVIGAYAKTLIFTVLLYVGLAQAWNLFSGLTGYVSFGHVLFFGAGAYIFAVAQTKFNLPWGVCLILAPIGAAVAAWLIALVVLPERMGIAYFAVLMLGLSAVIQNLILNSKWLGSSSGFTLKKMPSQLLGYYGMLLAVVFATALVMWVRQSRFGIALRALKTDEQAAAVAGVNCYALKTSTFVASAAIVGFLGAVVGWNWRYIDPYLSFDLELTFKMVLMAFIGGVGTTLGPIIGAVFLSLLDDWLSVNMSGGHTIIYGALVVIVILRMPGGLVDAANWVRRKRKRPGSVPVGGG